MSAEARFFPRARLDLIEQAVYLAENVSSEAGERFLDAVERTVASLVEMPRMGRVWEGLQLSTRERIRVWKVQDFPKILIFYRPEQPGISVIRILHGARDLPPLLEDYV